MKPFFCFFLIFGWFQSAIAQNHQVDSLQQLLKKSKQENTQKVDLFNILADQTRFSDLYKALDYAEKAFQLSQKLNYKQGIAIACITQCWIHHLMGHRLESQAKLKKAWLYSREVNKSALDAHIFFIQGEIAINNDSAKYYFEKARKIYKNLRNNQKAFLIEVIIANLDASPTSADYKNEIKIAHKLQQMKLNDDETKGEVYRFLGRYYSFFGSPELSAKSFAKALIISEKLNNYYLKIKILRSLMFASNGQDASHKGLELIKKYPFNTQKGYFLLGLSTWNDIPQLQKNLVEILQDAKKYEDYKLESYALHELGAIEQYAQTAYQTAIDYYQKSLIAAQKSNTLLLILMNYNDLAACYISQKKYSKADSLLNQSLKQGKSVHNVLFIYKIKSFLEESKGNYLSALQTFRVSAYKQDSLFKVRSAEIADLVASESKINEQEAKVTVLQKENELAHQKAQNRQNLFLFALMGIFSLSLLAYVLWRNNQIKQKTNQKLSESNELISILLQELNHRVLNNLQVVSMLISSQKRKAESKKDQEILEKIENRTSELANVHRLMMYGKNRQNIIDLADYLGSITSVLSKLYEEDVASVQIAIDTQNIQLPLSQAYFLGFIIHELFTNSLKYAYVDISEPKFIVQVKQTENWLEIYVSDNGKGMPEELWESERFKTEMLQTLGLKIISLITRIYRGSFITQKTINQSGTCFVVRLGF